MPNVGTVVRLHDGRIGAVSKVTSKGDDDHVVFADGNEERSDASQITELLTEDPASEADPITALTAYLDRCGSRWESTEPSRWEVNPPLGARRRGMGRRL
jgi:hypothetical protein